MKAERKNIYRIVASLVTVSFLCLLLYIGGCLVMPFFFGRISHRISAVREYGLDIPEDGKIGLICLSKPRIITFEGYRRIITVVSDKKPTLFFRFRDTFAGESNILNVFWYQPEQIIRLEDVGVKEPYEYIIDLKELRLRCLVRKANGTYWGIVSSPTAKDSLFSQGEALGVIFPEVENGTYSSPHIPIIEGKQANIITANWVQAEGTFLGLLSGSEGVVVVQ